jgi:hypothetical protein
MTTLATTNNPLQHLQDKAVRAHNWTSFSPDVRGKQMINDYGEELTADIEELQKDDNVSSESIADYKSRYERFFSSYLSAKSNCFSAMITGPAKFNTRKHGKANRSEQKHYEIFREWRTRAKKAIIRKAQPAKTFVSELDRYKAELAGMQANHIKMKEGNKIIVKAKKEGKDISQLLIDTYGVAPHMVDWCMKFGFGLTNNNANMKRVEQRIKEMEVKESRRNESPITKYLFEGGEFLVNYEVDRIQIFFDTRPTSEELTAWKAKGLNSYNWSPSAKAWQRKITPNALWHIKRMLEKITKA